MDDRPGSPDSANGVGERLRVAREAAGLGLEEVAQRTRVPQRHLAAIEASDMAALPAPPYAVGFVKSYARLLGLPAEQLGRDFRGELDAVLNQRPVTPAFEPADPARVPPRWLAMVALLVAIALAAGYGLWRNGTFGGDDQATVDALASNLAADEPVGTPPSQPRAPATIVAHAAANGPVVITATGDAWMRVSDGDKRLFMDVLKKGDHFSVPADAQAPTIRTGAPQSLAITVGGAAVPTLGPPSTLVRAASLKAADLVDPHPAAPPTAAPPVDAPADTAASDRPQHRRHRLPPAFSNDAAPAAPTPSAASGEAAPAPGA